MDNNDTVIKKDFNPILEKIVSIETEVHNIRFDISRFETNFQTVTTSETFPYYESRFKPKVN